MHEKQTSPSTLPGVEIAQQTSPTLEGPPRPPGGNQHSDSEAPLDLDNPAHLDALKRAYERFPEIGGRSTP